MNDFYEAQNEDSAHFDGFMLSERCHRKLCERELDEAFDAVVVIGFAAAVAVLTCVFLGTIRCIMIITDISKKC